MNERIPFVYFKTAPITTSSKTGTGAATAAATAPTLQGDRIENPDYIEQNNLVPDYLHYITNQIMKPILQLYALCLERLPGYDKCDEYWDDVERALLEKPMYQNEIRRKNRIGNLKLMMVKELLFDSFINILKEPKAPRVPKAPKALKAPSVPKELNAPTVPTVPTVRKSKKTAVANKDTASDTPDEPLNLEATIKITNKIKTKTIESIAFIKDNNNKKKKLWEKINDKCKNKDYEIIELIKEIIAYNTNNIYLITLNKKDFINEYNRAHYVYNDLVTTKRIYTEDTIENIMNKIMDSQDTGRLADLNNIRKYYELIQLNSKFIFMPS